MAFAHVSARARADIVLRCMMDLLELGEKERGFQDGSLHCWKSAQPYLSMALASDICVTHMLEMVFEV